MLTDRDIVLMSNNECMKLESQVFNKPKYVGFSETFKYYSVIPKTAIICILEHTKKIFVMSRLNFLKQYLHHSALNIVLFSHI